MKGFPHDILLPGPPSYIWPLPNLVLALMFIGVLLLFGSIIFLRYQRHPARLRRAKVLLRIKQMQPSQKDMAADWFANITQLTKRYAAVMYPEKKVCQMMQPKWLDFLSSHSDQPYWQAKRRDLLLVAYQSESKLDAHAFWQASYDWVAKQACVDQWFLRGRK
jgi:hypothetical protein